MPVLHSPLILLCIVGVAETQRRDAARPRVWNAPQPNLSAIESIVRNDHALPRFICAFVTY